MLLCQGSNAGGWSFYVKDGRLCYAHNYVGRATYQVSRAGPASRGQASAAVRVRAHRQAGLRPGQGLPRPGAAVRRRPAHRPGRVPGHHARRVQPRRAHLRRQPRLPGHRRLPGPVPLHRHAAHRHRRPVRRPHHRHRERDAHGHGPAITSPFRCGVRARPSRGGGRPARRPGTLFSRGSSPRPVRDRAVWGSWRSCDGRQADQVLLAMPRKTTSARLRRRTPVSSRIPTFAPSRERRTVVTLSTMIRLGAPRPLP